MKDVLLIALFALGGAACAGVLGAGVLRLVRRRSVAVSLAVIAGVTVTAMLAGTLAVAEAMFLSPHDLGVVTLVVAMAAVVSLATALLLGRWVVARSRELSLAARDFGDGGRFAAPPGQTTAELEALSRELAATSDRLAASRERERALEASRRELVAWISHDLRTPLAGLRAMSEALEDGMAADPGRYHRQIRTEVERLNTMVGDLFELSRIHAGALALSPSRMSLYDLVAEALSGVDPLAREHGVRLVGEAVERVPVEVDAKEMSRVLANLLVNAIRHTPADGTVAIAADAGADDGVVVLSVTDGCGGIPAEDLPRVFDTGWRGAVARTPVPAPGAGTGSRAGAPVGAGAGLGLAIVRGIVEAHAGRTAVHNVPGGCRFEVTLPVTAAAAS
ncbi:sensor histidine kinase [Streptomyces lavendulae]|uniref:Signal transduction histidine-protein kinase/phosphatase MprB n=1 Tax=Streptomyces lavendulae subsp. lavendulae TaxID=58340 RepID=A0A2K8PA30_STRLA|nr:HAMP domain-containing sensor histidine kinase [Streptomyces lavendulae]ATZ23328.1 Sensor histidine kinase YycG [Streptomyces lavendulae subsp. lavendulae]QUQ53159.1 Adaptive-response sensory-kinase SasA [Streptomyces lavendulae subsp. lavendulae]